MQDLSSLTWDHTCAPCSTESYSLDHQGSPPGVCILEMTCSPDSGTESKVTSSRLSKWGNLETFKSDALNSDLHHDCLPAGKTKKEN